MKYRYLILLILALPGFRTAVAQETTVMPAKHGFGVNYGSTLDFGRKIGYDTTQLMTRLEHVENNLFNPTYGLYYFWEGHLTQRLSHKAVGGILFCKSEYRAVFSDTTWLSRYPTYPLWESTMIGEKANLTFYAKYLIGYDLSRRTSIFVGAELYYTMLLNHTLTLEYPSISVANDVGGLSRDFSVALTGHLNYRFNESFGMGLEIDYPVAALKQKSNYIDCTFYPQENNVPLEKNVDEKSLKHLTILLSFFVIL